MAGFLRDMWEESFLLILFNFLWVLASVPGWLVFGYGGIDRDLPVLMLGFLLLLPWPFFTFALQSTAADIGERRAVGLASFFQAGRRHWRPAYAWGILNLVVGAIVAANVRFYGSGASPLGESVGASLVSSFLLTLFALWGAWQLFSVASLPHLPAPDLRSAWRESGEMIRTRPAPVLMTALAAAAIALLGAAVPPIGLLFSFSAIAVLVNRAVVELHRGAPRTV